MSHAKYDKRDIWCVICEKVIGKLDHEGRSPDRIDHECDLPKEEIKRREQVYWRQMGETVRQIRAGELTIDRACPNCKQVHVLSSNYHLQDYFKGEKFKCSCGYDDAKPEMWFRKLRRVYLKKNHPIKYIFASLTSREPFDGEALD